jgi:hypothetical protein
MKSSQQKYPTNISYKKFQTKSPNKSYQHTIVIKKFQLPNHTRDTGAATGAIVVVVWNASGVTDAILTGHHCMTLIWLLVDLILVFCFGIKCLLFSLNLAFFLAFCWSLFRPIKSEFGFLNSFLAFLGL